MSAPHQPVLKVQVLNALHLKPGHHILDCTVGAGGHAESILHQISPTGQLVGLDVDPEALKIAQSRLAPFGERVRLVQANFDRVTEVATRLGFWPVDAILADLGVSSMQLDEPERGFSFSQEGPLDMRMGPEASQTAADLINTLTEQELADLIYRYGEERKSRPIARAIVKARPIYTTLALAEVVSKAAGGRRGQKIHPATRTFQAIRIAVNDELGALERFLPQAVELLAPGGRLAVISFHSLEDRLVKRFLQQEARDCLCPPKQPTCTCQHRASVDIITAKPIIAEQAEVSTNPRARSAKLRVAQGKERM
jgi:16S rRNA (cytosine1402-N4)-methyltransferase